VVARLLSVTRRDVVVVERAAYSRSSRPGPRRLLQLPAVVLVSPHLGAKR
jgi:hypothetical protein